MTLATYRQFCSFITSCNDRLFAAAHITTSASDVQFGHTGLMDSAHYDGDVRLPSGLDRGIYKATARTSATAQILFGHPPDLMVRLCKGDDRQNRQIETIQAIRDGRYVAPGEEVFVGSAGVSPGPGLAITSSAIVDSIRSTILPELFQHGTRALSQAHAALVNVIAPNQVFSPSNALSQSVDRHTHPFILRELRRFMVADGTLLGFTGSQQAEVTQLMYDGVKNIGYFAATGKSQLSHNSFPLLTSI